MNDFQTEQLRTALEYNGQGFNVLPLIYGEKKPAEKWAHWQDKLQTVDNVRGMFEQPHNKNIGIIGGAVSGNLSIIDFDKRSVFNDCRYPFETLLNHTPAVTTKRGAHIYVRTTDALTTGKIYRNGEDVGDLKAQGGYVVAPNSLLKANGHQYTFWNEFEEVTTLETWELYQLLTTAGLTLSQSAKKQDSETAFQYLINPGLRTCRISTDLFDTVFIKPLKGLRSEREQSLIYRLYCIGWGFYEMAELFKRYGHAGTHYGQLNPKQKDRYLQHSWGKAAAYYDTQAPELYRTLDQIRDKAPGLFTGRTADTDRAVLFAIMQKCRETGLYNPQASHREIAERAGVQRLAAQKAIARLKANNIISSVISKDFSTAPAVIILNTDTLLNTCVYTKLIPYIHSSALADNRGLEAEQAADLFRYGALGKKGQIILKALEQGKTATTVELNLNTGINPRVIKRILKRAELAGIVIKTAPGKWAINPKVDVTEAAKRLGVDGKGKAQRERHNAERTQYKSYLKTKAEKETPGAA